MCLIYGGGGGGGGGGWDGHGTWWWQHGSRSGDNDSYCIMTDGGVYYQRVEKNESIQILGGEVDFGMTKTYYKITQRPSNPWLFKFH